MEKKSFYCVLDIFVNVEYKCFIKEKFKKILALLPLMRCFWKAGSQSILVFSQEAGHTNV